MIRIKNRSIQNILWLTSDSLFRMGGGFFISVWLARYMGVEVFGSYNYCLALIAIFSSVATLGMNGVVVKELINQPLRHNIIMGSSCILQIIGSLIACILVTIILLILKSNDEEIFILLLVMLPSIIFRSSDLFKYWFESKIVSKYSVISQNIAFVISLILKILIITFNQSYLWIGMTVSIEVLIQSIFLLYFYKKREKVAGWIVDFEQIKLLLSMSWPLVISGLALMLYMRIGQIMIGNMLGNSQVGIYSVAIKFSEIWYFFPVAVVSSLFPKIIEVRKKSIEDYNKQMQLLYDIVVWLGILLALTITLVVPYLIEVLFGLEYVGASTVSQIYAWSSIFYFLSSASGRWYINEGLQHYAIWRNFLGLLISIVLNFVLIPIYGINGVAFSAVISFFGASYLFDIFSKQTRVAFFQKSKALWVFGSINRILLIIKK